MLSSAPAHTVAPGEGRIADLGIAQMRVLAAGQATTDGAFTLTEFTGRDGPWTVPHLHRDTRESFFVLDGQFTFTAGDEAIPAGPGSYILVPRGTRHTITAGAGGGRLLVLMVPGRAGGDVLRTRGPAARQHHRPGRAGRGLGQARLDPRLASEGHNAS